MGCLISIQLSAKVLYLKTVTGLIFNVMGSFRRMEAHSTRASEKEEWEVVDGRDVILTFLLSLTLSSSQRWS